MGLYDREYYRESADSGGGWLGSRTICQTLMLITGVVFVLQLLTAGGGPRGFSGIQGWLQFQVDQTFLRGQLWRLITYAFIHDVGNLTHIVFNMLGLYFFGPDIESIYGRREFLRFYLVAALCGALCHTGLVLATGANVDTPMLGASGAVLGVLMLYARHFPRRKVFVMGVLPVEIRWLVAAYVVFDLLPVLNQLSGGRSGSSVAHAAHLGGLLYGFLFHQLDLHLTLWPRFDSLLARRSRHRGGPQLKPPPRRRANVRLHEPDLEPVPAREASPPPETADFSDRVDQILAKIHADGEASLTPGERRFLEEAAERYKKRR